MTVRQVGSSQDGEPLGSCVQVVLREGLAGWGSEAKGEVWSSRAQGTKEAPQAADFG